MRTATRVVMTMGVAAVMLAAASGAVFAAAGDVSEKGEQLYIWHFDEGAGEEVEEAGGDGPPGVFVGDIECFGESAGGEDTEGLLLKGVEAFE